MCSAILEIRCLKNTSKMKFLFTGWPTDRVFNELIRRMDRRGGVFVIVLDEIDHLVRKAGDDLLYNLTNMNSSLKTARACVIGISNDLKFTDFLDLRARSRLGQLDVLFRLYDAEQLQNILRQRAEEGLEAEPLAQASLNCVPLSLHKSTGTLVAHLICSASPPKRPSNLEKKSSTKATSNRSKSD